MIDRSFAWRKTDGPWRARKADEAFAWPDLKTLYFRLLRVLACLR